MTEVPPLRVLQLLLWMVPGGGGIQTYLRGLLQAFDGAGDVKLLGAAVNAGQAPRGFAGPAYLGSAGAGRWRNALAFARHVIGAARGADVVQINGIYGPQFMLGAPCCWLLGVPYIVNPLNALAPWMLAQKALKKKLFFDTIGGFFLRKAACVLGTSEPEAEFLARRFPRATVRLVRVGVEVPEAPQVELLQAPPGRELRLLYLGAFDRWKRVPMLVRTVAALRARGVDARATIAGQGSAHLMHDVTDEIARLRVGEWVTMAGFVAGQAKLDLIRRAHVLVLPAATDSYSLAAAEAMAQGLPVVITQGSGAAPDVLRHRCGSVIPVEDDVTSMVDAVREYADAAVLRERALAAHRHARAALALPKLREQMTALYREMCAA